VLLEVIQENSESTWERDDLCPTYVDACVRHLTRRTHWAVARVFLWCVTYTMYKRVVDKEKDKSIWSLGA